MDVGGAMCLYGYFMVVRLGWWRCDSVEKCSTRTFSIKKQHSAPATISVLYYYNTMIFR